VHKASVTSAVLRDAAAQAECVDRLPNALPKLERYVRRWQREGTVRVVYEASSAGFVLQRACAAWGVRRDRAVTDPATAGGAAQARPI
jgi:hypothetical protein